MREPKFPVAVRRENVTVKIYRQVKAKRYPTYLVTYYDGSQRRRLPFSDYEEARDEANDIADKLAAGDLETIKLTGRDRLIYLRAAEAAERVKRPLDLAIMDYAEALAILDGKGTLLEAAQRFAQSRAIGVATKPVTQVVAELLDTRRKDGSSDEHIEDLDSRLSRFAADFKCMISAITPAMLQEWLLALNLAPRTVNNYRMAISNLFSFAVMKRYVAKDGNPISEVPAVKLPEHDVTIWQPNELQNLLAHASPEMQAYVAIASFGGLRQSEIERLDWGLHVTSTHIKVPGDHTKRVKSKRLVEMQPNLRDWIEHLRKPSGPVVPYANISNCLVKLARRAGFETRYNAYRHSFGSYRLAATQHIAQVADEMGNSVAMVKKHYRELVTREAAEQWFSIRPTGASNVIPFQALLEKDLAAQR